MSSSWWGLKCTAAILAVLTACTSSPTGKNPAPTPIDPAALLFTDVPKTYEPDLTRTKTVGIEDVAAGVASPGPERARLRREGFVTGFVRTWTSRSGTADEIIAFVYVFETAVGADAESSFGLRRARTQGDTPFRVASIPGAHGVERSKGQAYLAVFFVRGTSLYLVAIDGPSPHSRAEVIGLAVRMNEAAATAGG